MLAATSSSECLPDTDNMHEIDSHQCLTTWLFSTPLQTQFDISSLYYSCSSHHLNFTALTITRYRVCIAGGGQPRREVAETGRRADLDIASRGINALSKWCRFGHNVTPCELSGTKDTRGFNLGDSYVDENDYPRSDIDIPVVLNIARRIRCLQTELTDLNEKICEGLNDIHSKYIARCNNEMSAFAVVDKVLPNSTGEVMGLKKHDKLFRIGEFKVEDFESCDKIVELLENAHNMKIVIERDGQLLDMYFNGNGADVDNGLGLTLGLVKRFPLITMESP
ncbi:26S proteasome non-ATPase regulatory subunit 9 [Trichinella patagoniensis]|uniref:26S proteasome non-ATPase regulatory subunit 9 n=1 Tax=Trichinella patagoniensis TaxID=990121 RepID=A0A0V0ZQJ5_9BILA|nr:26S proteasome non-ATPase regulatory subunit 9 [Trichinella patagoniensis]